jgi:hypothetical protein
MMGEVHFLRRYFVEAFQRPLNDKRQVEHFVKNILEIPYGDAFSRAVNKITATELQCNGVQGKSTLIYDNYREVGYVTGDSRIALRKTIFEELVTQERPENDDDIRFGYGGALPRGKPPQIERQAYVVIGPPASGKSAVSSKISDHFGAIILDSDFAKRKFPEYPDAFGAFLVHDESTAIVFGEENIVKYNLLEYCCAYGYNIVIPRIGHKINPIIELAEKLKKWDYAIHLTLVNLDRKNATQRAYYRFEKTGRYVPLSLIFDGYSNEPILSYYVLRDTPLFKSYGQISTDVPVNSSPKWMESSEENPAILFK